MKTDYSAKTYISMKINHYLVKGEVRRLKPNIYCVAIKDCYDRAMLFSRYQEFYESPIKGIRNKYFTLEGLMKRYRDHYQKDAFTYPEDWAGYNIPSYALYGAIDKFGEKRLTEYDDIMREIVFFCEKDLKTYSKEKTFYLLGSDNFSSDLMDHEMAHALYYTNPEYKKNCQKLISKIKKTDYEKLWKTLVKIGYLDKKVIIDDEIQAFMSTGLYDDLELPRFVKYEKGFINNFNNFK